MRLGVLATTGKDRRAALERVRIAEDLGYEHVATGDVASAAKQLEALIT